VTDADGPKNKRPGRASAGRSCIHRNHKRETAAASHNLGAPSMSSCKAIPVSDAQLTAILRGATPLRRQDFDAYLALVAEMLNRGQAPPGDGDVFRAIRLAQGTYLDPPHLETHLGISKYGR
jgi:hypothetical protein